jgi:DNA-dependent protein kinase catalytic subunit
MSEVFPILPIFLSYPGSRTVQVSAKSFICVDCAGNIPLLTKDKSLQFESVFSKAILNLMPMSSSEYERGSTK